MTAARRAGLRCIAIPNPFVDRARFEHADLLLGSAAELSWDQVQDRLCAPNR